MLKEGLIFVSGLAIGGLVSWYVTKEVYEDRKNREIDEVTAAMKKTVTSEKEKRKDAEYDLESTRKHFETRESIYKKALEEAGYDIVDEDDYKGDSNSLDKPEVGPQEEEYSSEPYFISEDEFEAVTPYYDKLSYTCWQGDKTVTDDATDEPVEPDDLDILGQDVLTKLYADELDNTAVYIRSDAHGVDFEIYITKKSKYEEDMG